MEEEQKNHKHEEECLGHKKKSKSKKIKRQGSGSNNNSPRKTMKTRKDSSTLNAQRYESSVEEKLLIEDNNKCRFIRLTSIEQPEAPVYSPP